MENGDDWLAPDKLYHFLFCFFLAFFFSALATLSRYPLLRRLSIWVGSLFSLAAGAAKEAADEVGFFKSAGASAKDAAADLLGTVTACLLLLTCKRYTRPDDAGQRRGPSLV
ncbi:uncharacterized protein LOC131158210 [Malania oleifera]|uniref:uncharacterized protein LOC131158210 n=1 Tax=Malania oleifera TaxID=397392 RepID=UPI0025ADD8C4|nr:uncharacterized protein LOC131158210 [Malania oleifera]XP_057968891.1 uncharacterized protein LOC131158210 [Malania oleifera]XP_057968892.1 uncharacterized protein LOC131158210 [Malania oleifera]XP_057968893.1 uncharacterized protein LOC131158210 [Malania oleifera]XP_057968894.1 uncharacterized protein LOC131158210 [Malania oleifera]XP_057968895.1 uncharacterized protein LOC131158210 [Malania oleifera]XP_057968896.1 uncharacterized protein LOC131158210 [Malania oleifera]XP_057968897.1 unc